MPFSEPVISSVEKFTQSTFLLKMVRQRVSIGIRLCLLGTCKSLQSGVVPLIWIHEGLSLSDM